ncbi:hypothetical protein LSAT2_031238 [Lamellibrachia satsuma]|nr:hypothetical protein LSAT2_031238 [Lamellibrachia satsuma]
MRATIILLFMCLAFVALADDNAGQLEKTDEEFSVSLDEDSDEVSGRNKREENPLLTIRRRTRRHADDCHISCRRGRCHCNGYKCRCYCSWWFGVPRCRAKYGHTHYCQASCKKGLCGAQHKCVRCSCSLLGSPKCKGGC